MSRVHVPTARAQEIARRIEEDVSDWDQYAAMQVARWAYRQGVRDERARANLVERGPA